MLQRAKSFLAAHEKRLSVSAFLLGFLWDNLTLSRIDRLFDNLVLAAYLVIALAAIVLVNAHGAGLRRTEAGGSGPAKAGRFQGSLSQRVIGFARFILPFAFGGLFSGFLIFYSRSGEVLASLPFLFILAALFFGNELFRRHYVRFIFQMSVFFVALFSYSALIVPVLWGRMGAVVFVASGLVSLILFALVLRLIALVAREEVARNRVVLWSVAGIMFVTFNLLYFNNMIPPIPLSLKSIGIYHSLERTPNGEYRVTYEPAPWYALGKKTSALVHRREGESVYAFSSVFAPAKLDTDVVHRWSYRDGKTGEWMSSSVIGFPISGGRQEGYRGYSVKENIAAGRWRVDVETLRGQIIGRFAFTVEDAPAPPALVEKTL